MMNLFIDELPRRAVKDELVALDLEMFEQKKEWLHTPHGIFACLSIAYVNGDTYVITKKDMILEAFDRLQGAVHVYHNALYDLTQLVGMLPSIRDYYAERDAVDLWDTMLVDKSLYGGYYSTFALNNCAARWLEYYMDKSVRETFSSGFELTREQIHYAAVDALVTVLIAQAQDDYIDAQEDQKSATVYFEIDAPAIWPILDMKPQRVDVSVWNGIADGILEEREAIEKTLGINPRSVPQVKKQLASMGYRVKSTGKDVLAELVGGITKEEDRKYISSIIRCRSLSTYVSRYGHKWTDKWVVDGHVTSGWKLSGARTGRMSSSNPNLQQIPSREYPIYRTAFLPEEDEVTLVADVSQQEPCILGYVSGDPVLVGAIHAKEDLHQSVADQIGMSRAIGKSTNLGMSYGLTPVGLARNTGLSVPEAEKVVAQYFARFRGVDQYMRSCRRDAQQKGYVTTPSGRRVWVNPHHHSWQTKSVNAPIQGGASDQMKVMLYYLHMKGKETGLGYHVTMVVHDEVVCSVPKDIAEYYAELVLEAWEYSAEQVIPGIPIRVDVLIGENWGVK